MRLIIILFIIKIVNGQTGNWTGANITEHVQENACENNTNIFACFELGLPPESENQYFVYLNMKMPVNTIIRINFDSKVNLTLTEIGATMSALTLLNDTEKYKITLLKRTNYYSFAVQGTTVGVVPYLKSLMIDGIEYCAVPRKGFLDKYIQGYRSSAETHQIVPDNSCGRRQVVHTDLIVSGFSTKAGEWPWHAAVYQRKGRIDNYMCGGTLITKNFVVTAAHCATRSKRTLMANILRVMLGKYNFAGGDKQSQEMEIKSVIVHKNFFIKHLDNDIALLKLKSEVTYTDYIQPACLWFDKLHEKLGSANTRGVVVGWGFDHTDHFTAQLRKAVMPMVMDTICMKRNPTLYTTLLNNNKFCAGPANGTSACNGDSGGGYMVFVPDNINDNSTNPAGSWYLRGIISISAARKTANICDPNQYTVFTDIVRYREWIQRHIAE